MNSDNLSVEQMDEGLDFDLDLRKYFSLFLQWLWLIVVAGLVAGLVSYFVSKSMTPYYASSTLVLVNEAPATRTTDYNSVLLSKQLANTYSQMMARDPILIKVADQLGLTDALEDIKEWITVAIVQDTQLIEVTAETTDPVLSADIANAIAIVFADNIQEIQSERFSQSKATLATQLDDVQKEIDTYATQAERASTTEERDRLEAKVTQYRGIYSNLTLSYEQVRLSEAQAVSSVVQVEPATPVLDPVKPRVLINTLLAAVLGSLIASSAVIARDVLDDTIKTPEDIKRKFNLPILGVIDYSSTEPDSPITITDPRSPTVEAYRKLRTNIKYTSVDRPLRTLIVTSAEPGEGKSTIITNLGVVMAQSGKKVILADCDLRRPSIHTNFGLPNRNGMSTLFAESADVLESTQQPTQVKDLTVVTSGSLPPNPSELIGSQKMQTILEAMRQSSDVILLDVPPVLTVSDTTTLAPSLDGVILVVRTGKTRASAFKQTIEQLHQVNARVLGIVLNGLVKRGKLYGYQNYTAYQSYYGNHEKEE